MPEVKETKAQRVERLKRAKNPWEHFDEIRAFARQGFGSIPPEWLGTYFRPWGIYTQGDGAGVTGGKNGEGKAVPFFMVRIRIPNGLLTSTQARTIADLSDQYGNGVADITVRQNIQLHWVAIENLPEVLDRLWSAGLTTTGACGDVTRNITGCPDWCSYPEINDIGLTATRRTRHGGEEIGFSLRVAGGLSTEPHLAVKLNAFIQWHQVIAVVRAISEVFKESEVLRQSREHARLKYLFLQHGWTAESFLAAIESKLGYKLDPAEHEPPPASIHRDHLGVVPQKQFSLFSVGASVIRGRITPAQFRLAADLADRYGDGHLRNTPMQNLLLINIGGLNVPTVVEQLNSAGLPILTSAFVRGTVACTGSEFCKLALTETKSFA